MSLSTTLVSSIFDEPMLLDIEFDFCPGYKQTWDDPGCGHTINITSASGRVAALKTTPKGESLDRSHVSSYKPTGDRFVIPTQLYEALLS